MNQPGINLKSGSTAKLGAPKLRTDFRPKLIFCRHLSPPRRLVVTSVVVTGLQWLNPADRLYNPSFWAALPFDGAPSIKARSTLSNDKISFSN
jgi:hypothetical protein